MKLQKRTSEALYIPLFYNVKIKMRKKSKKKKICGSINILGRSERAQRAQLKKNHHLNKHPLAERDEEKKKKGERRNGLKFTTQY